MCMGFPWVRSYMLKFARRFCPIYNTSAPLSRRISTQSVCPLKQAACRGCTRSWSGVFTLWPAESRSRSFATSLLCTAWWTARDSHCAEIDHFWNIAMDTQTTGITHFALVFHYDVTMKAYIHNLRSSTACHLWHHNEKQWHSAWSIVWHVKSRFWMVVSLGTWKWTINNVVWWGFDRKCHRYLLVLLWMFHFFCRTDWKCIKCDLFTIWQINKHYFHFLPYFIEISSLAFWGGCLTEKMHIYWWTYCMNVDIIQLWTFI